MRTSLYEFCRSYQKELILTQWDAERNLPLTPQTVTYGSKRAIWWHCENKHF